MPENKKPDYTDMNWDRLIADRTVKWNAMKAEFAAEGILPTEIYRDDIPGFDPAICQEKPALYILPIIPGRGIFIVCAGGGFLFKSSNEAKPVAEFFHRAGINAAVLDYRVRPYDPNENAVQDGLRAVRYVRLHAAQWGIPADKIAIGGFSAGGMLSSSVATRYDAGNPNASDPVERVSSRPDAALLLYGAGGPGGNFRRAGGYDIEAARASAKTSAVLNLRQDSPPFFLFQTHKDDPHGTLAFAQACADRGIEFEIHAFREGPHGGGLYNGADEDSPSFPHTARWPELAAEWLRDYGF